MGKFSYTAIEPNGGTVTGVVRGDNALRARTALMERDYTIVTMREKRPLLQMEITKQKVKQQDVMHFTRQLAAFIRAGIPILEAIQVLQEDQKDKTFARILAEIREDLQTGQTFSEAIAIHGAAFPKLFAGTVHSAEMTGRLDLALDQLSEYIERDLDARRKIRSALSYPAVIFVMAIVTTAILATFVLPKFETFFKSFKAQLPLPTRMLIHLTHFLERWWWALLGGLGSVILIMFLTGQSRRGRQLFDRWKLKLPIMGSIVRHAIIERFCRILSAMVRAGVPMPEAMITASEGTNNVVYEHALLDARDQMIKGEGIARPISATQLFPNALVRMVRVGEDTGTLDQQLEMAAEFYEKELGYKLNRATTLFEPAVIIVMGVLVGFVAIALISAIYGIYRQVKF